jgi:hypothetical protein
MQGEPEEEPAVHRRRDDDLEHRTTYAQGAQQARGDDGGAAAPREPGLVAAEGRENHRGRAEREPGPQGPVPGDRYNALWTIFATRDVECAMLQRESQQTMHVARLRSVYGRHVGEPVWEDFIRELSRASEEFSRLCRSGDVAPPGPLVKRYRHATLGELGMTTVSFSIHGMPECRMVTYHPSDEDSERRLRLLRKRRERRGRFARTPASADAAPEPD